MRIKSLAINNQWPQNRVLFFQGKLKKLQKNFAEPVCLNNKKHTADLKVQSNDDFNTPAVIG